MDVPQLQNSKISVIGAARSGIAVARLLKSKDARVFVSDNAPGENLESQIAHLESIGVKYEIGGHSERVYDCALMVLSPGVSSKASVVVEAQKRGIEIRSELEVASWFCRAPIIAVTGSNGKTTTTTLVGRILGDAKKRHVVAGNIGTAFSAVVPGLDETSVAVLEVSSFQLDFSTTFHPKVSIILNITPDHMDRYDNSMEKYSASKARIVLNQTGTDILIFNEEDEWCKRIVHDARCKTLPFSVNQQLGEGAFVRDNRLVTLLSGKQHNVIATDQISIPGVHNLYNSMAAVLAGQVMGVSVASIRATLKNFKGVEHRLEFVREVGGIRYVNDSKATNVHSVWYALQAYNEPIVLLLGGRDKGNDYSKLFDLVRRRVKGIVAIGESADKVAQAFQGKAKIEIIRSAGNGIPNRTSFEKAVQAAKTLAQPGDVVLLSPACASFDWFHDYEERGRIFKELVAELS